MKNKQSVKLVAAVIVLVAVVAVYAGITMWNKSEADKEAAENESIQLLNMSAEDISAFSYQYNGETVSFVKEDGTWYLDSDRDFPVKQSSIEGKLSSVASTTASRQIEISEDHLADYGLDAPVNTITVTDASGHTTTLEIGDQNSTSSEYYCRMDGSDQVYMISSSLDSMMSFDVYTVADMSTFPVISSDALKEITVACGEETKDLDKDEDSAAFSAVSSLYYTAQIDYQCEDLSEYGLDKPAYTVTIKYLEDSEEESEDESAKSQDTESGSDSSETVSENTESSEESAEETEETYDEADLTTIVMDIGDASDNGYYVRIDGSDEIHEISSDDFNDIVGSLSDSAQDSGSANDTDSADESVSESSEA